MYVVSGSVAAGQLLAKRLQGLVGSQRAAGLDLAGLDPRLASVRVLLATDVDNPLLGPHGAARVFAPQKGATPGQVDQLERGLRRWAEV